MRSLTPRLKELKETQRARAATVSTFARLDQTCLNYYQRMTSSGYSVLADDLESDGPNALRYVPGKSRSHHLEMMLSKEELEEEQRSVKTPKTQITARLRGNRFIVEVPALSRRAC